MSQASRTRPSGSSTALSEAYDTALLDLDGVVYAGGAAIAHAVDSLGAARDGGMHLAYVTNNALRTPAAVAEHLTELGVPAESADVITSAQAVARLMADQLLGRGSGARGRGRGSEGRAARARSGAGGVGGRRSGGGGAGIRGPRYDVGAVR